MVFVHVSTFILQLSYIFKPKNCVGFLYSRVYSLVHRYKYCKVL